MLEQFQEFIQSNFPEIRQRPTLLGVSGGEDSVVMTHLFHLAELPFCIAHCNFQLRDTDSDLDASFVKKLGGQYGVTTFEKTFDTVTYANEHQLSIQVAARNLRYQWFSELLETHNLQFIATAHHLNDSIETLLYNLTKGCGISGLHGIPTSNKQIIRPILFAAKSTITSFCKQEGLKFRTDYTNDSDTYTRNFIRHQIIPSLKKLNPNLENTFQANIERFKDTEILYFERVNAIREKYTLKKDDLYIVDIQEVMKEKAGKTVLFELLKPYEFSNDISRQIFENWNGLSGKQFFSPSHQALLDRDKLYIKPLTKVEEEQYLIYENTKAVILPEGILHLEVTESPIHAYSKEKNLAVLDFNTLTFPLTLRRWQKGDSFQPLGLNGKHKKISHFFRQEKLSLWEKISVWMLTSEDEICWVLPLRIDERFKVKKDSKKFLKLTYENTHQ